LSLCLVVESVGLKTDGILNNYPVYLGAVSLSYVAGFVAFFAPGGVGIRELVFMGTLTPLFASSLDPPIAEGVAIVVALILRLSWTIGEIVVALSLYFLRPRVTGS